MAQFSREGAADCQYPLPHIKFIRVTQLCRCKIICINLQHSQIALWISPDNFCLKFSLINEQNRDLVGPLNDMIVGQDIPVSGVNDHT